MLSIYFIGYVMECSVDEFRVYMLSIIYFILYMYVSSCGMTTTYYTYVWWTECDGVVIRVIRPAG